MAMTQEAIDWRYLPYILGLFFRPKFQGISPENMARNVVQYLHFRILKFPLMIFSGKLTVCYRKMAFTMDIDDIPSSNLWHSYGKIARKNG